MDTQFRFIAFNNDVEMAIALEEVGLDAIYVDLEKIGKLERQGNTSSWITNHELDDISVLRSALKKCRLGVRVNPLGDHSEREVQEVIDRGADRLMLPMFHSMDDALTFLDLVGDEAKVDLLVETRNALTAIAEFKGDPRVNSVHFGLNDLSLDSGYNFMFEVLELNDLDEAIEHLRREQIPFGIGGVGHLRSQPVSGESILAQHVRLGSSQVILSRSFLSVLDSSSPNSLMDSANNAVRELCECIDRWQGAGDRLLSLEQEKFCSSVREVVKSRR